MAITEGSLPAESCANITSTGEINIREAYGGVDRHICSDEQRMAT